MDKNNNNANISSGVADSRYNEYMILKNQMTMLERDLNKYKKDMELAHEFSMYLQSCPSLKQTHPVIRHYMSAIFPQWVGECYLFNDEKVLAQSAITWGDQLIKSANIITHNDCWALRLAKSHVSPNDKHQIKCNHVEDDISSYICVPIIVHNDILGVLHIGYVGKIAFDTYEAKNRYFDSCQKLAEIVADHLSSAFTSLKLREALKNESIRDPLTSLYNRRYMEECMKRSIARSARSNDGISIIMIDIDHFKRINDEHGHSAGDTVLSEFAKVATDFFRGEDIVCRYGGEEFIVIIEKATEDQVMKRATDFCHKLRDLTMHCDGITLPKITASFGVLHTDRADKTTKPSEMINKADSALYKAKESGRDQVFLYQD